MAVSEMILMTGNLPFVRTKNRLRYEKTVSAFSIITAMVLVWTQGTSGKLMLLELLYTIRPSGLGDCKTIAEDTFKFKGGFPFGVFCCVR